MKKARLILIRHGQSEWNKQDKFTGWVDVSLSPEGKKEVFNKSIYIFLILKYHQ